MTAEIAAERILGTHAGRNTLAVAGIDSSKFRVYGVSTGRMHSRA